MAASGMFNSQTNSKKKKKNNTKLQSQNENNQSFDDSLIKINDILMQKSQSLFEDEYSIPKTLSVDNDKESENFQN